MKNYTPGQIRRTLRKYSTKKTEIDFPGGLTLAITEVENAYALLDRMIEQEARRRQVDRFPYWAELWPASVALARWFCTAALSPSPGEIVELGCGLGLVGVTLARLGWRVRATDFVEDALVFASHNALANQVGARHRIAYLDWSNPAGSSTSCMVASDVVYEKKNHAYLNRVLRRLLEPGGRFFLSDPQRPAAGAFVDLLRTQDYAHQVETCTQSWLGGECQIDIHQFTKKG